MARRVGCPPSCRNPPGIPDALAARLPFLRRRALLTAAVRAFFLARGYLEVETPYAVPTPGEEVHLSRLRDRARLARRRIEAALAAHPPEFAMKRLLVGGSGPIFQLARVWRNGEASDLHAPEFTMLEWYRPGADMADLIAETPRCCAPCCRRWSACRGIATDLARVER